LASSSLLNATEDTSNSEQRCSTAHRSRSVKRRDNGWARSRATRDRSDRLTHPKGPSWAKARLRSPPEADRSMLQQGYAFACAHHSCSLVRRCRQSSSWRSKKVGRTLLAWHSGVGTISCRFERAMIVVANTNSRRRPRCSSLKHLTRTIPIRSVPLCLGSRCIPRVICLVCPS
jgi:hypothetical protein